MSPTARRVGFVADPLAAIAGDPLGGLLATLLAVGLAEPLALGVLDPGPNRALRRSASPSTIRAMISSPAGRLRVSTMALGYPR
jgi:Ca2+/H+ antiporter